jgi:hypothetical protein
MTMHLLPVYYTTTSTKKRKKKNKSKSLLAAEKEHQEFLKKIGVGQSKNKRSVAQPGSASALGAEGRRFESYRSDQKPGWDPSMAKKQANVYTGTEIIGIAQMHKSNAVPIRGKKDAIEVARMRRG